MPEVDATKAALDELIDALSAQLIGEPIEIGDKIIMPVTKMAFGFGADIGQSGPDASRKGRARCNAGGGVGTFPVAVVVVFKGISGPEGVKVVPLSPPEESIADIAHIAMGKMVE